MSNPYIIRDLKKQISNIQNFQNIDVDLLDNLHISLMRFKADQGKTERITKEQRRIEETFYVKAELEFLLYLMESQETIDRSLLNQVMRTTGQIIMRELNIKELYQPI